MTPVPTAAATILNPGLAGQRSAPAPARVPVGKGGYTTVLRAGGEREPPAPRHWQGLGPVPTHQWYSSLLFSTWPQPLFAQPLSYWCDADGWQMGMPDKVITPSPSREENDIRYPHQADWVLLPTGFALKDARVAKVSDWALDVMLGDGQHALTATIAHGSPYAYYRISQGDVRLTPDALAQSELIYQNDDHSTLAFRVRGKVYGLFLPRGARLRSGAPGTGWLLTLADDARFFSMAVLPDASAATIRLFARHAFAFIRDTRIEWHYDEATSRVTSRYRISTDVMQGTESAPLIALYPHQWHDNPLLPPPLSAPSPALFPLQYPSVRGPLKLWAGHEFATVHSFHGVMPFWPALSTPTEHARLARLLREDMQAGADALLGHDGSYWQGKGLGRATQLMIIAEQQGDQATRNALLAAIKARMESWLRADQDAATYFHFNRQLGTLIGYPDEFGSASELNDHHFHYGYWIYAASQIALRDPAWASAQQWGGMIDLLAQDIANSERGHASFPFLRHFDVYEGHSWASGTAPFFDGNNQESTSEAIHAWAGLILWGEATGNKKLRDTGVFLYTQEINATEHYWFDAHKLVFAPEYANRQVGILWGNQYVHGTWFTDDPRETNGINYLPLTPASTYLGRNPAAVQRNSLATDAEFAKYLQSEREQHAPAQIWQDVLLEYLALSDPQAALKNWDQDGMVELGETRSHTYHWIMSLLHLGRPDFSVTANTPCYGVFQDTQGKRHYLAYNTGASERLVRFSDGKVLRVAPHALAYEQAPTGAQARPD